VSPFQFVAVPLLLRRGSQGTFFPLFARSPQFSFCFLHSHPDGKYPPFTSVCVEIVPSGLGDALVPHQSSLSTGRVELPSVSPLSLFSRIGQAHNFHFHLSANAVFEDFQILTCVRSIPANSLAYASDVFDIPPLPVEQVVAFLTFPCPVYRRAGPPFPVASRKRAAAQNLRLFVNFFPFFTTSGNFLRLLQPFSDLFG